MGKKSVRSFSELRSLLKRTETEAEARAVSKAEVAIAHRKRVISSVAGRQRRKSAADELVDEALALPLEELPIEQFQDARSAIRDAMECVNIALLSIRQQLEMTAEGQIDVTWRQRATAALRHKIVEGHELTKRMARIEELISRAKPTLTLVQPRPPPAPMLPAAAFEIRTGVPHRPRAKENNAWRKYPFDKLEIGQSFRFGTETKEEVKRLIANASRHLGRHFSYRVEQDGVVAVWRVEGRKPDA